MAQEKKTIFKFSLLIFFRDHRQRPHGKTHAIPIRDILDL